MSAKLAATCDLHVFDDSAALAEALALRIADELRHAIAARAKALLAVSGGKTPERLFEALSRQSLDWTKVTVTLVDERWTPRGNERSNALSVTRGLLRNAAAGAHFIDLYVEGLPIEDGAGVLDARIDAAGLPFDAIVLGMGHDGHTASYFPGGDGLAEAVDASTESHVVIVRAEAAIEPRVTLTMPVILGARFVALHIEGEAKRSVLDKALKAGDANAMPIRHVLRGRPAMPVYWAP